MPLAASQPEMEAESMARFKKEDALGEYSHEKVAVCMPLADGEEAMSIYHTGKVMKEVQLLARGSPGSVSYGGILA